MNFQLKKIPIFILTLIIFFSLSSCGPFKFERADVGDKYVTQMLSKKGWMLGGESSGHIICRDLVSTGDGTIAALKVISSLLLLEKNPKEVLSNYKKFPQININIPVKNKDIINDSDLKSLIKEVESDINFIKWVD